MRLPPLSSPPGFHRSRAHVPATLYALPLRASSPAPIQLRIRDLGPIPSAPAAAGTTFLPFIKEDCSIQAKAGDDSPSRAITGPPPTRRLEEQAAGGVAAMGGDGHPYAPADLHLPGFVPLQLSQGQILAPYLGTSVFVVLAVWLLPGRCRGLSKTDRVLMCWWAFTGLTHIIIEGTFVFNPGFFRKENPNYFDEVWKEYSKGDSRYAARDPATVTVEGITAVLEGPASLLAVYAIASHKSYSHILQFTVCLGQLYGCLVYFITAYLDGFNFWVSPFYFWAYFILANSFWVWIPTLIAMRSWKMICAAFRAEKAKKTR